MLEVIYIYGLAAYLVLEVILVTVFLITFWSMDRTKKSKKSEKSGVQTPWAVVEWSGKLKKPLRK
jgi:hypothetical protein